MGRRGKLQYRIIAFLTIPKGAFKYYISRFWQILDPQNQHNKYGLRYTPPPKMLKEYLNCNLFGNTLYLIKFKLPSAKLSALLFKLFKDIHTWLIFSYMAQFILPLPPPSRIVKNYFFDVTQNKLWKLIWLLKFDTPPN